MMQSNTFDEVLGLEEQFYDDGFRQGLEDGVKAGRVEGRTFGLEKGFEKYIESGRLYGKSIIWANRIPQFRQKGIPNDTTLTSQNSSTSPDIRSSSPLALNPLPESQRLAKHLKVLHALAESESLSTENTEEAVSDFDDRLKRAQGKAKIIERLVGENKGDPDGGVQVASNRDGSIEDTSGVDARH